MPGIQLDTAAIEAAAKEAAMKLGLKEEGEESESATEKETPEEGAEETSTPEKEDEETTEEVGEAEETEEEEEEGVEEEEAPPSKRPKTMPMERFNAVYARMKQLERALAIMQANPPKKEEAPPKKEVKLPDFEQMDEKSKAEWLLGAVGELVESKISEKITPIQNSAEMERANRDVQATAARHADYLDYAPQMIEIANSYPNLKAEDVYQLAKARSPKATAEAKKKSVEIARKAKEKIALKKKASVERRSSASEKVSENKEYRGVRDAGLAIAEKLGLK